MSRWWERWCCGRRIITGGARSRTTTSPSRLRLRHHLEHLIAVHLACVGEQRLYRGSKGVVLLRSQLVDFAAGRLDGLARGDVFFLGQAPLKGDRLGDCLAHRALEVDRPSIEPSEIGSTNALNL